jgi:hypothetical protein
LKVRLNLGLRANEGDRALVVADPATREELAQTQPERLAMGEPPVDRPALGLGAVMPVELD